MPAVACEGIEACVIDGMYGHARGFGARDEVTQSRILAPIEHVQRMHGFRPLA